MKKKQKRIALLFICLNPPYWPFLKDIIEDARIHFLKDHKVDFFVWSDMPEVYSQKLTELTTNLPPKAVLESMHKENEALGAAKLYSSQAAELSKHIASLVANQEIRVICNQMMQLSQYLLSIPGHDVNRMQSRETVEESVTWLREQKDLTIFPTESAVWPIPTLMRYHLFLQQEELLKEYDYLFYLDADMRIVDTVGDEVLGKGLTMAEHPMYSLRREYIPPYEPNIGSAAFIKRFGTLTQTDDGKPWFKPLYAAGGFQGGTPEAFIKAMKVMRKTVDSDFGKNYVAIWNDESHWNKYLSEYTGPLVTLSPSYVYPDSLIEDYYKKVWGKNYKPIIVTLTKKFSISKESGADIHKRLQTM